MGLIFAVLIGVDLRWAGLSLAPSVRRTKILAMVTECPELRCSSSIPRNTFLLRL
jgi:hypothetical protein